MLTTMKIFCWATIAFFIVGQAAVAQSMLLKTGDKLVYEVVRYDMRGSEMYVASTTVEAAEVQVSAEGFVLNYTDGRVQKFDASHTLIERTVGDRLEKVTQDRQFKWMPDEKDFKSTRKLKETFQALAVCGGGTGTAVYEATPRETTYRLTVAGKETEVAAVEFLLNGQWSAGTCGMGKQIRKYIYAPELDTVVLNEFLNYRPNGAFLSRGSGWMLKSIN